MVKRCINPECQNEFRHLYSGNLFALETESADTQFVWLCADCAPNIALKIDALGLLSVGLRTGISRTTSHDFRTRLRPIPVHGHHSPWHRAGLCMDSVLPAIAVEAA